MNAHLACWTAAIALVMPWAELKAKDIIVPAASLWVDTGVRLEAGRRYKVQATDFSTVFDQRLPVRDVGGWPASWQRTFAVPIFWVRRRPLDPWFAIIATVERKHPVRLRTDRPYIAPASGELVCYFNDAVFAYGNNRGAARLQLTSWQEAAAGSFHAAQ